MYSDEDVTASLGLSPAQATKARAELHEPACLKQCCSRVQDLLRRLQDAGLGPDTPWMCGRAPAYAVMYLRCGQGQMPVCGPAHR